MSDRALTVYCGLLMAVGAFSIDITLPFFSVLRDSLSTSNEAAYATITLNVIGLGIGQLIFGPVSDRYGRRRAIAIGLSLFLAAALMAALSTRIEWFLLARSLQGLGGGAAPVAARAMIRDRFTGAKLGQNMAIASGIFSIGPIAAPLCGALLIEAGYGWRIVFVAMAVLALGLLLALWRIPETLAARRTDALSIAGIGRDIRALFAHPQSRFFLIFGAITMINIVMIISGIPLVMETAFGVTGITFALLFAIHGIGIIAGQILNHWLIGRYGMMRAATTGAWIITIAFAGISAFAFAGKINLLGFVVGVTLFAVGYLMVFANAASMTLEPHGQRAGFTAAFFGAMAQLVSAIIATGLVTLTGGRLIDWSFTLFCLCLMTLLGLHAWSRRERLHLQRVAS